MKNLCKLFQKYGRMDVVELEKSIILELNKKRHATKHFTDKPVDPKDVRYGYQIATLFKLAMEVCGCS